LVVLPFTLCGGCFCRAISEFADIRQSANAFLDHIEQGKVAEAYNSAGPIFRSSTSVEQLRAALVTYPALTSRRNRTEGLIRNEIGGVASVRCRVVDAGKTYVVTVYLTKVEGRWRTHTLKIR